MTEMLMTDQAATTTEGTASSQTPASNASTDAAPAGTQQQATSGQNQQATQDGQAAGNTDGKVTGAPEAYEFKAPEGKEFDPEVINSFSDIAKELDLPQDAAQKMIDKLAPKIQERQMQVIEQVRNDWAQQAQTDKEYGGEKLTENLAVAKKALDAFGTPELRSLLNESGLGNNPEVIRFMFRAGKAISEDRFVGGAPSGGKSAGPKSFNDAASALYSNQS
jgi:hypothetical protein